MVRGERLTLTCANCGEVFTRLKSQQVSKVAYCSDACRAADVGARRTRSMEERSWRFVNKTESCWLWTGGTNNQGYGLASLPGHNGGKMLAHRYFYELANGPIPEGMRVCHNCPGGDNPLCVNPAHLFLGTQAENVHDMWKKGRQGGQFTAEAVRGENGVKAKLTAEQVAEIRRKHRENPQPYRVLAAEYGVDQTLVGQIIRGKIWKHTIQQ